MKHYIPFEPTKEIPFRDGLFYECMKCGKVIPGDNKHNVHCDCRNIFIDADYGRIQIRDYSLVRLFDEVPD